MKDQLLQFPRYLAYRMWSTFRVMVDNIRKM